MTACDSGFWPDRETQRHTSWQIPQPHGYAEIGEKERYPDIDAELTANKHEHGQTLGLSQTDARGTGRGKHQTNKDKLERLSAAKRLWSSNLKFPRRPRFFTSLQIRSVSAAELHVLTPTISCGLSLLTLTIVLP